MRHKKRGAGQLLRCASQLPLLAALVGMSYFREEVILQVFSKFHVLLVAHLIERLWSLPFAVICCATSRFPVSSGSHIAQWCAGNLIHVMFYSIMFVRGAISELKFRMRSTTWLFSTMKSCSTNKAHQFAGYACRTQHCVLRRCARR